MQASDVSQECWVSIQEVRLGSKHGHLGVKVQCEIQHTTRVLVGKAVVPLSGVAQLALGQHKLVEFDAVVQYLRVVGEITRPATHPP